MLEKRLHVLRGPGQQIVDTDHFVAAFEQCGTHRSADQTGAAGHEDPHQERPIPV